MTTQDAVLHRLGFKPSGDTPYGKDDDYISLRLKWIIDGLAYIGTYITGTDHLTDRELLIKLEREVLKERIRFVPPTNDHSEFIDFNPTGNNWLAANRDATLPRCPFSQPMTA